MNKERLNNAFAGITYMSLGTLTLFGILYLAEIQTCPYYNLISICYEEIIPVINIGLFVSILAIIVFGVVWYFVVPIKKV